MHQDLKSIWVFYGYLWGLYNANIALYIAVGYLIKFLLTQGLYL